MAELIVIVTTRCIFYTLGDLFIIPSQSGVSMYDTVSIRDGEWGRESNHPIGLSGASHITGQLRMYYPPSTPHAIPYAPSLYYIVRALSCGTYRIDDRALASLIHLRMVWRLVCDSINGMLY